MDFAASITTNKGMTIGCRVLDPAQAKWWSGTQWDAEATAAVTGLAVTTLASQYENLYTGAVPCPDVSQRLVIEYMDLTEGVKIAEDTATAPISVAITPDQTTTIANTVAAAVTQGIDPLASNVANGTYPAGTAGNALGKLLLPNNPPYVAPIPVATAPGTCQVYADLRDFGLEPKAGVEFTAKPAKSPQIVDGLLIDTTPQKLLTDETGRVTFTLAKGSNWFISSAVLPAAAQVSTLNEDAINIVSVMT